MKILAITDVTFPRINGVSTSIATFHREYLQRGHRQTIVAPGYGGAEVDDAERERDMVRIPSWVVPFDPEDRMMRASAIEDHFGTLSREGFDLVHIQTPFIAHHAGVRIARRLGLPTVETYHTYFEEYLFHYIPFLPRFLGRSLARRFSRSQCNEVDAVVVPSRAMERALRDYGVQQPMHRIPTGLRLDELAGGDGPGFRRRHGIPADRPMVLHVGRMGHEKNIEFLIDMMVEVKRRVPDVLLVLAGEGPARKSLQRRATRRGLDANVLFVGYLDRRTTLLDCYRAAEVFVFASRTETQGLVLLESMALGTPLVSTAVMGTADILEPKRGALVVRERRDEFAAAVVRLLGDTELRRHLGEDARRYAAEWSAGVMAERMLDLYASLLDIQAHRSAA